MILRHRVTYQGYPCVGVNYRRSEGFEPEPGWVDIPAVDLKNINIRGRNIPWAPVNGQEMEGPLSGQAWSRIPLRPTGAGSKPKSNAELDGTPPGSGLEHFGTLVMRSIETQQGGNVAPPMVYSFVYVDSTGLEEVTQNLARAKAHNQGIVRVPLTDMRKWYADNGCVVCRMNSKDTHGEYDLRTLHPGGGSPRPFTLRETINFLFSQLPGTPDPFYHPSLAGDAILGQPGPEIIGRGEPAKEHLIRVLRNAGISAKMLPTGNFRLTKKGTDVLGYGKIASDIDVPYFPQELQYYETASVYLPDRSPAVLVLGKPIIRRVTIPYVPVIQDTDGLYYQLADIEKVWDYPLEKLKAQVLKKKRPFADVPPLEGEALARGLQRKRIDILRECAYKMYAPAAAFDEEAARQGSGKPVGLTGDVLAAQPFLPMNKCPVYVFEFEQMFKESPLSEDTKKGDVDRYLLVPPIVRGFSIGEGWFKDFAAVEAYFFEITSVANQADLILQRIESLLEDLADNWEEPISNAENTSIPPPEWGNAPSSTTSLLEVLKKIIATKPLIPTSNYGKASYKLNADLEIAAKGLKNLSIVGTGSVFVLPHLDVSDKMNAGTIEEFIALGKIARCRTYITEQRTKLQNTMTQWRLDLDTFKAKYEKYQGIDVPFMTLPYGILPSGSYSVDYRTGILKSSEPLAVLSQPFALSGDSASIAMDSAVTVTYGYEAFDNQIGALTSVLVAVDDTKPGAEPTPVICGFSRSSPIKGRVVTHPTMRMFQDDKGNAMNSVEVQTAALDKVAGLLDIPSTVEGYSYTFNGLIAAVLEGGTTHVEHLWDPSSGSDVAMTRVAVNAPGTRGMGGIGLWRPPGPRGPNEGRDDWERYG